MTTLQQLRDTIAEALAQEKAYNLPAVCSRLGLDAGDENEALASKRSYVKKRLVNKTKEFLTQLASVVVEEYDSEELASILSLIVPKKDTSISIETRKKLMDELFLMGRIEGELELVDFLKRIWPLDETKHQNSPFSQAEVIRKKMISNNDWTYGYLFDEYLNLTRAQDIQFLKFLEQIVHPLVRPKREQMEYVSVINKYLSKEGYELQPLEELQGRNIYIAVRTNPGVETKVKNLIFAAIGPKPRIVITDSLNNDIKIVENAEFCLVYDQPIPETGLLWQDLVKWWAKINNTAPDIDLERKLFLRLRAALKDSEPEKLFFSSYFNMHNELGDKFPALIPQVYLHYDPYTIKQLGSIRAITRQRMDFLLLFSNRERVIIEIDGKQHYSSGDRADPEKYAEMVAADRNLKLAGYELYRFGGYELQGEKGQKLVETFFHQLFQKYSLL